MSAIEEPGTRSYLAIIGDIRGSRSLEGRAKIQKRLEEGLEEVNREFEGDLAAGFVVTLGDEFQGLLSRAGVGMAVVLALEDALAGIPLRYGLGWGTLSTELRSEAVGMDGPCLQLAREAVVRGKREGRWVTVTGFGEDDVVLNGTLLLMGAVRDGWTRIQSETVRAARRAATQRDVAAARGRSESTVSKALRAALHDEMSGAEQAVATVLARFDASAIADDGRGRRSRA